MKSSYIAAVTAGITLMLAATLADAACVPNNCAQLYDNCIASGTRLRVCEAQYAQCLLAHGCPIP